MEPTPVKMTSQTHEYLIFQRLHQIYAIFEQNKRGTYGEYAYLHVQRFSETILQRPFHKLTCIETRQCK